MTLDLSLNHSAGLCPPLNERVERPVYPTWTQMAELGDLLEQLESARAGEAAALERVAELEGVWSTSMLKCYNCGHAAPIAKDLLGAACPECGDPLYLESAVADLPALPVDLSDNEYSCPRQWIK